MADSTLRGIIIFFDKIGIYDVVLPFLLIFSIVFAILEKSRILGTVQVDKNTYTKKNLNAMVAFVIAFIVIASTQVVAIINEALAHIALMLMIVVSFMLLIGIFFKTDDDIYETLKNKWRIAFMIVLLVATALIFLDAIKTKSGESWLSYGWNYIVDNWDSTAVGSIILVGVLILMMLFITHEPHLKKKEEKS